MVWENIDIAKFMVNSIACLREGNISIKIPQQTYLCGGFSKQEIRQATPHLLGVLYSEAIYCIHM